MGISCASHCPCSRVWSHSDVTLGAGHIFPDHPTHPWELWGLQQTNSSNCSAQGLRWNPCFVLCKGSSEQLSSCAGGDKVTDYSKGFLIYENDVTLGLSPTPFQAPKQTEMPFSYFSSGFTFFILRRPFNSTESEICFPFSRKERRKKEVQIAIKTSSSLQLSGISQGQRLLCANPKLLLTIHPCCLQGFEYFSSLRRFHV